MSIEDGDNLRYNNALIDGEAAEMRREAARLELERQKSLSGLKPGWSVTVKGPDADGLIWLVLNGKDGGAAFSVEANSVRGGILKAAKI